MHPILEIPLTRVQFEQARTKLSQEQGIHIVGDQGEVEGHRVGVKFSYDGSVLEIEIEHKPWVYPEAEVEKEIRDWFAV